MGTGARYRAVGSSRAILFCSGLFAAMLAVSYLEVNQAGTAKLGARVELPEWPFSFAPPVGWVETGRSEPLGLATPYDPTLHVATWADSTKLRLLQIRVMAVPEGTTAQTLGRWYLDNLDIPARLRPPSSGRNAVKEPELDEFEVHGWPATIGAFHGMATAKLPGIDVYVCSIVPPAYDGVRYAVTLELQKFAIGSSASEGMLKAIAASLEPAKTESGWRAVPVNP
jgi:hypothetical protein